MTTDPHPDTIPSVSLLPDWRFFRGPRALAYTPSCEDEHWQPVILPHTWNDEDMAPDRPMLDAYQGVGWYRCRVHLRPQPGERILLRLDAATMEHEVWVDGSHLGGSDCGFLATRHDITEALLPEVEEHCIAVRVSNAPQPGLMPPEVTDWERYGGLIRPVWIERRGDAHFSLGGIALRTTALDTHAATLQITCELREWAAGRDLRIVHRISDPDGATVQELERRIHSRRSALCSDRVDATLPEPLRWSPDAPRLYRVRSELYDGERLLDACEQRIGLRTMVWDAQRGFLLNGERLELVGVNAHQDYPGCGHALPERFHRAEVAAIKAAGLNCLRGAHYPRHEAVLDACDELGVLVIEELPFWHGSCRTQHGQALIDSAGRQARELVRQHGNHPSIIAWNTVNEIMHVPGFHEAHLPPEMRSGKHRLPAEEWAYARRVIGALAD
ncbi:MAG: glycoside hydrolase family 2 protein, partial [Planctomycetota bacterium]